MFHCQKTFFTVHWPSISNPCFVEQTHRELSRSLCRMHIAKPSNGFCHDHATISFVSWVLYGFFNLLPFRLVLPNETLIGGNPRDAYPGKQC